jgi:hypothetical protein
VDLASAAAGFFFTSSLALGSALLAAALSGALGAGLRGALAVEAAGLDPAAFLGVAAGLADLAGFPLLGILLNLVKVGRDGEGQVQGLRLAGPAGGSCNAPPSTAQPEFLPQWKRGAVVPVFPAVRGKNRPLLKILSLINKSLNYNYKNKVRFCFENEWRSRSFLVFYSII